MERGKVIFYKDKQDEYRWKLLASNGQQIANGAEGYITLENCWKGFESVKKHIMEAEIIQG